MMTKTKPNVSLMPLMGGYRVVIDNTSYDKLLSPTQLRHMAIRFLQAAEETEENQKDPYG